MFLSFAQREIRYGGGYSICKFRWVICPVFQSNFRESHLPVQFFRLPVPFLPFQLGDGVFQFTFDPFQLRFDPFQLTSGPFLLNWKGPESNRTAQKPAGRVTTPTGHLRM
jgi:hypothetical protein